MKKTFTAEDAFTVSRFFAALERQIERAYKEGREDDARSICRLSGRLEYHIFGCSRATLESPLTEAA
jgi:hypothetical protein